MLPDYRQGRADTAASFAERRNPAPKIRVLVDFPVQEFMPARCA